MGFEYLGIEYKEKKKKTIRIFVEKKNEKLNSHHCEKIHNNVIYVLKAENYLDKTYKIEISSKGIKNLTSSHDLKQHKMKILKIFLTHDISEKTYLFGKLIKINFLKRKLYIQNKKKIILLYFYQIDKIQII